MRIIIEQYELRVLLGVLGYLRGRVQEQVQHFIHAGLDNLKGGRQFLYIICSRRPSCEKHTACLDPFLNCQLNSFNVDTIAT